MMKPKRTLTIALTTGALLFVASLLWGGYRAWAKPAASMHAQVSPLHPTFILLDQDGSQVLETGNPVSTMRTCGACHDTEFIVEHSYHVSGGLNELTEPGSVPDGRPWDTSPGIFGRWNPLQYRYLTPEGDERLDLSTAEWIMLLGERHTGGGPAAYSREGNPLSELAPNPDDPQASLLDPESGKVVTWDWNESGVVEMNCFLCHTPEPDNQARKAALEEGAFAWANTATLLGSGIVEQSSEGYTWNPQAFDEDGALKPEFVTIQDPGNENCGLCHGLVHDNLDEPLVKASCEAESWSTETTGQIVSPQRLSDSGMNLRGKEDLSRTWDVHAERAVNCTDCHYSLNNPVYFQGENSIEHLDFDPRRIEIGEYLAQPVHDFARGQSAQGTLAPELKDSMRRCESCHNIEATHDWLPYKDRHVAALTCETCHIPKLYSPAIQQVDWTVIQTDSKPQSACRGYVGESGSLESLITGYEPVLMSRQELDGDSRIAPYNLITAWFWVYGDPPRPVREIDLQAAWLNGDSYHADVLTAFDENFDGELSENELMINSEEKQAVIAGRLKALGLQNPRIQGEIQPYSINHDIAAGEWATRDCKTCHSNNSRTAQPFLLASYTPAGVIPEFVSDSNTLPSGKVYTDSDGKLYYQPTNQADGWYILGYNHVNWIDTFGGLMFFGVLLGIALHGGLRFITSLRKPQPEAEVEKVYMYSVYERFWHWLQTFAIVLLLFTGLIIHKPDTFGILSFRGVVIVHNVLAVILAINAAMSLFYHLASGEIRQYIPRPYGFFDQAIVQAKFYLQGIFKREAHPFEKVPGKKLNPLQQVTYFGILNVLLPLQGLTGILMWGVQRWPEAASALGGLPFLAPFHTLIAWTFASFIVAHVYLTTTGPEPLAGIKAMMMGWEDLETPVPQEVTEA